jgi:hypothetical protein
MVADTMCVSTGTGEDVDGRCMRGCAGLVRAQAYCSRRNAGVIYAKAIACDASVGLRRVALSCAALCENTALNTRSRSVEARNIAKECHDPYRRMCGWHGELKPNARCASAAEDAMRTGAEEDAICTSAKTAVCALDRMRAQRAAARRKKK